MDKKILEFPNQEFNSQLLLRIGRIERNVHEVAMVVNNLVLVADQLMNQAKPASKIEVVEGPNGSSREAADAARIE